MSFTLKSKFLCSGTTNIHSISCSSKEIAYHLADIALHCTSRLITDMHIFWLPEPCKQLHTRLLFAIWQTCTVLLRPSHVSIHAIITL